MTTTAFFRGEAAARAIERASRCGGIPVCIHVAQGSKWVKVAGAGSCLACAYVASTPGGKTACEACRGGAAAAAAKAGMGRPFICHMGFACYCAPIESGVVVTFGPYCPSEQPESLAADFMSGLAALGEKPENLPVSLADVRLVPSSAVPALAAWTQETLDALRAREEAAQTACDESHEEPQPARPRRAAKRSAADPYGAGPIAAALAGGAHDKARALFRAAISEAPGGKKTAVGVKRARTVAAAAAVLESAARASLPVDGCWESFNAMLAEVRQARNELQLVNVAMRVLAHIKRQRRNSTDSAPSAAERFKELSEIVAAHIESGITLQEVAARLGQTPTAITHRLQRNFGMSYSDYVGRLRVDKAKELLRRTRLTVEAVGRRVGIEDASNFRKLFRKFETISPQEYRQRFGVKK